MKPFFIVYQNDLERAKHNQRILLVERIRLQFTESALTDPRFSFFYPGVKLDLKFMAGSGLDWSESVQNFSKIFGSGPNGFDPWIPATDDNFRSFFTFFSMTATRLNYKNHVATESNR